MNLKLFQNFKNSKINVLSGIFITKEIISSQNCREKTFGINLQQDNVVFLLRFFIFSRYKNDKLTEDPFNTLVIHTQQQITKKHKASKEFESDGCNCVYILRFLNLWSKIRWTGFKKQHPEKENVGVYCFCSFCKVIKNVGPGAKLSVWNSGHNL